MNQHTLLKETEIKGIGLHSGCETTLRLLPAPAGHGIVFERTDLPGCPRIKALYSNVVDTRNCTCLGDSDGNIISTVEHLMAALSVLGIDNLLIKIDNQEMPIMDGSALPFLEALSRAGVAEQREPRRMLKVLKEISFTDDNGNSVTLIPAETFSVDFEIEFPSKIVGFQKFDAEITPSVFAAQIAPCRTFCEKYQVDYLRSIGLIKGGSLDNAVVLDGETLLNPEGFRVENECVNHKVIDAVGDLYTSGYPLLGRLIARKSGHFHNNQLLRRLFADESNYQIV